jgi:hypothetical protein
MDQPSTADLAYGKDSEEAKTARTTDGISSTGMSTSHEESQTPLIAVARSSEYSTRWQDVQAEFVDEPQKAVKDADGLVAEVIQTLATTFADQRRQLEDQWKAGGDVSTEDLRQALMQYRTFFQRLLAA